MTRHYQSPRLSAEVADCSMPVTFDQYSGCSYGCLYCFSTWTRGTCGEVSGELTYVDVERVKRLWTDPLGPIGEYIRRGHVLQWGGLADPFCEYEREHRIGLELLRFWRERDYPLCLSTKGTWWTRDSRYMDVVRGGRVNCKFSIITLDPSDARVVEPRVPAPRARLRAIERFAALDAGGATLRLRPFIPGVSDKTYVQLIKDAANAGATALSTEFLCIEIRSMEARRKLALISEVAEFDLFRFYKEHSHQGYLRLDRATKRGVIDRMEQVCSETGMRFYVFDAHFKERCHNGSCCGLSEDWSYSRGQYTEALIRAKRVGSVRWSDIETDLRFAEDMSALKYLKFGARDRARFHRMSVYDWVHYMWNNPNRARSPYRYFEGVLVPTGVDADGDVIYSYDEVRA